MVIAGLGNPGAQYAATRHNVGFRAVDHLTVMLKAGLPKEKFDGLIFSAKVGDKKVLLVKPQTYMNESGRCLRELLSFYKLKPENLIVIYDDIDIPEGTLRIRVKGGPGTHNGMRSIVHELQSENFMRVRIGTGAPIQKQMDLADFVLGKFAKESQPLMEETFLHAAEASAMIVSDGIDKAMQKYNTGKEPKVKEPKEKGPTQEAK